MPDQTTLHNVAQFMMPQTIPRTEMNAVRHKPHLAYLQDDVLGRRVIVAALLVIASSPIPRERLIEWLQSLEGEIQLMAVIADHLCQVVHKRSVVLRGKIVLMPINVSTAGQPSF